MTNYKNNLTINSEKRFDKSFIRDTRISVHDVLSRLASGMTYEEIISEFPEITKEDINVCFFMRQKGNETSV